MKNFYADGIILDVNNGVVKLDVLGYYESNTKNDAIIISDERKLDKDIIKIHLKDEYFEIVKEWFIIGTKFINIQGTTDGNSYIATYGEELNQNYVEKYYEF